MGGIFSSPPAVASYAANRLDVFARGTNNAMYHKAWNGGAWVPETDWDNLGGAFSGPPAVASWGNNRLDIFAIGTDNAMHHFVWAGGAWIPPPTGWENLGGVFNSPPAVASWGNSRLDIFGVGTDNAMHHKAWNGAAWLPSKTGWDALGGGFNSTPAVTSYGSNRLDVFGLGNNNAMYHKAWNGAWLPSQTGWDALGDPFPAGVFECAPAVASWGGNNLSIIAIGTDNAMYFKSGDGTLWFPSQSGWAALGGAFSLPPTPNPVTAPAAGLGSNSNYYLYGGVKSGGGYIPLQDVVVTIDVTEDIVGSPPFSFQLNGYSPHNDLDGWQQYGISMAPGSNQLNSFAENWPLSGNNLFNIEPNGFITLPNQTTVPKGYKIVIRLSYASGNRGNIDGSVVTVYNGSGTELGSQQISLIGQPLAAGGTISEGDLAPIVAFQLDLVGWAARAVSALSSGAGTITYSSSTPMTAQNAGVPDAESGYITAETANSIYGVVTSAASQTFVQSFGISDRAPISMRGGLIHSRPSRFRPAHPS